LDRAPAYRRLSLYWRVVIVNATVLLVATMVLSLTPAYVPFPDSLTGAATVLLGLFGLIGVNALLLRPAFTPLTGVAEAMGNIDLLRPGARLRAAGGAEVTQVIATFNEMLDRLEHERFESNRRTHLAHVRPRPSHGEPWGSSIADCGAGRVRYAPESQANWLVQSTSP
jgi:two-component system sensor histidine kinase UhpB